MKGKAMKPSKLMEHYRKKLSKQQPKISKGRY